jgi:hypothetical protein
MYSDVDTFTRGSIQGNPAAAGGHVAKIAPKCIKVLKVEPIEEKKELLSQIDEKASLADRVREAAAVRAPGFPIYAGIECGADKAQLRVSVYTAKSATALPETNPVTECEGEIAAGRWSPSTTVFGGPRGKNAEFKRIARGASLLSRMQRTRLSLYDVIRKASEYGIVYRVEPVRSGTQTVFGVLVKDKAGKAQRLQIDFKIHPN